MQTGILFIVATPIGNLQDITFRAVETLRQVDSIACEDTRTTRKLLNHYNIATPTFSYHQHSGPAKYQLIRSKLLEGKNIALVTDAGTPGVSDPGNMLIQELIKDDIRIVPIPGPSALAAIISVAGIDMQKFSFLGFPPHKKGRETFFKEVAASQYPVLYYDSPHRFVKNLKLVEQFSPQKKVTIGREMTKIFEEVRRGESREIIAYFEEHPEKAKGEMAVIVYG